MTLLEKFVRDHPDVDVADIIRVHCPEDYLLAPYRDARECLHRCESCWNREYIEPDEEKQEEKEMISMTGDGVIITADGATERPTIGLDSCTEKISMRPTIVEKFVKEHAAPTILDSGDRTEFETGAVRDRREGKGRCDLMPLDVISYLFNEPHKPGSTPSDVFTDLHLFMDTGAYVFLKTAIDDADLYTDAFTMFLEVAKHFEEGAKKYGENNWQKGIPVRCYIDSAVRHYLKHLRGDADERHDRAFVWNIMCAIWTCIHKPELNDYRKDEPVDAE